MEWLRRHFAVVRFTDLAHPGGGSRPRVALTFDDGYADNLHVALPVLERFDLPATFFVTSGQVGGGREFWWDELERLLLHGDGVPHELRLSASSGVREWLMPDRGARLAAYYDMNHWLKPLPPPEQQSVLRWLHDLIPEVPPPRATHLPLTREELLRLADSPLATIGGHTVGHVTLAATPPEAQEQEIVKSLTDLGVWVGRPITTFSYPYGGSADIGALAPGLVARAGCVLARANWPGLVLRGSDRFRLPGLVVRDWAGEELARRLGAYVGCGNYDAC
jgi:peptidoglycan/xylan/chitin deacetylase (PgdA/CDA1 family)